MKTIVSGTLQIITAIVITTSTAYAMSVPKQAPSEHFNQETVQTTSQPETAVETPQNEPVVAEVVTEPVVAPVETQPELTSTPALVETPVATEPVEKPLEPYATGNSSEWLVRSGIDQNYWTVINFIIGNESIWCPYNWQGEIGKCVNYHGVPSDESGLGYGLCQSTPASKMASAGADWATNPQTQLKWCDWYAHDRYGGWGPAYQHWLAHRNW